jgi:6,7-dimethyl-8-ribityllumazine synthase
MARQILNPLSGAANDKLGDTPNAYTTKLNAMTSELYTDVADTVAKTLLNTQGLAAQALLITANADLIAAQGLLITANADAIIATNASIAGFTKTYWFLVDSTSAAISHTAAAANTYLLNNALGADTTSYNPDSKAGIWNTSTNQFVYTSLKIGDVVNISGRFAFNHAAAQEVDMFITVAEGTATSHEHHINHVYYKTAGTGAELSFRYTLTIQNSNEVAGASRFRFASLDAASITVNDFQIVVTEV